MYIDRTNAFLILLFSVTLSVAFANDHEDGGKKEEKKEEAAPTGDFKRAPWMEVETRVQDLHARIKSKQAAIGKMLEEKNHMKNDSPELKLHLEAIVKEHKELRQLSEDYRKNLSLLQYRFPERNAKADRKYDRIEVKSLEEMEKAVGIDGKLNRNISRMRSQYKLESVPEKRNQAAAVESKKAPEKKTESIEDAGSIIINK